MTAEVIAKAVAPEAKAVHGLTLVANINKSSASLSVSSAMKIVITMITNASATPLGSVTNNS